MGEPIEKRGPAAVLRELAGTLTSVIAGGVQERLWLRSLR